MTILQEERTVYFRDSHVYCRINNFNQQAGLVSLRVQAWAAWANCCLPITAVLRELRYGPSMGGIISLKPLYR
jgi:hypothetical protein